MQPYSWINISLSWIEVFKSASHRQQSDINPVVHRKYKIYFWFSEFARRRADRLPYCRRSRSWHVLLKCRWFQTTDLHCLLVVHCVFGDEEVLVGRPHRLVWWVLLWTSFSHGQGTSSVEISLLCLHGQFSVWHRLCSDHLPVRSHCERPRRTNGTRNSLYLQPAADAARRHHDLIIHCVQIVNSFNIVKWLTY